MNLMKLTIISSNGIHYDGDVSLIRAWTPEGQIEILPGHCTYIGLINPGQFEALTFDGKLRQFSLGHGSIEHNHGKITVLTDIENK